MFEAKSRNPTCSQSIAEITSTTEAAFRFTDTSLTNPLAISPLFSDYTEPLRSRRGRKSRTERLEILKMKIKSIKENKDISPFSSLPNPQANMDDNNWPNIPDNKEKESLSVNPPIENQEPELNKALQCSCKNSQCIKLYCECFKMQKYCYDCSCVGCFNLSDNPTREQTIKNILKKNPKAFLFMNVDSDDIEITDKPMVNKDNNLNLQISLDQTHNSTLGSLPVRKKNLIEIDFRNRSGFESNHFYHNQSNNPSFYRSELDDLIIFKLEEIKRIKFESRI